MIAFTLLAHRAAMPRRAARQAPPVARFPSARPAGKTGLDVAVDANGNMSSMMSVASTTTTSMTTSYSYDARDRMVQVTLPSGRAIHNEYLPDSPLRLFFTKPDGAKVNVLWDLATQNLAQDLDVSNATVAEYIQGNQMDETLGMIRGGSTFAYVTDQVQSVRNLIDANGAAANAYYTNSPFGEQYFVQESVENRLRFTSREWEQSSGVQYNRNRFYLPSLGRWSQRDPSGFAGGFNLYGYTENSPVDKTDPSGLFSVSFNPSYYREIIQSNLIGAALLHSVENCSGGSVTVEVVPEIGLNVGGTEMQGTAAAIEKTFLGKGAIWTVQHILYSRAKSNTPVPGDWHIRVWRGSQEYFFGLPSMNKTLAILSYPPFGYGYRASSLRAQFGPGETATRLAVGSLIAHELTHVLVPIELGLEEYLPVLNEAAFLSFEGGRGWK